MLHPRFNPVWLILIIAAVILCVLYLYNSMFPAPVNPEAARYFSPEQTAAARDYHRVLRVIYAGSFLVQAGFLLWFVFTGKAFALSDWAGRMTGGFWVRAALYSIALWSVLELLSLPVVYFSGYYWQRFWGLSTQSLGSWWFDYLKSSGINLALFIIGSSVFLWIANRYATSWWLITAALLSVWLIVQSYLWPSIISPLFNTFSVVSDPDVVAVVSELSTKADLPIDQILKMDASRRTTQANAYFTGIGRTKRIVLYDTLLDNYSLDEIKAVIAHEMAHWQLGHIVRGLSFGVLGVFLFMFFLKSLVKITFYSTKPGLQLLAIMLLSYLLVSMLAAPVENGISRWMEKEADLLALELTDNSRAAINLHINLAKRNLSDVSPSPYIVWLRYTHPPVLERIRFLEEAAKG